MLVFVDESGDAGMKLDKGSSELAVLFEDGAEAQRCDDSFAELRRQLGFPASKEFRFHGAREPTRQAFLSHVKQFDFQFVSVVLDKRKLSGHGFQFKESVIKETTRLVFESLKPNLTNATVIVDGSGDKAFDATDSQTLPRTNAEETRDFPTFSDQSGSGWESNPPSVFSDATLGLKPRAVTRAAYTPEEFGAYGFGLRVATDGTRLLRGNCDFSGEIVRVTNRND